MEGGEGRVDGEGEPTQKGRVGRTRRKIESCKEKLQLKKQLIRIHLVETWLMENK